VLDPEGFVVPGSNTFSTDTNLKATLTPVIETGDDIAIKNGGGDLSVFGKHDDMVKHATVAIEFTKPDAALEAACCGGVVLASSAAALGAPSDVVLTTQSGGTLPAGEYAYEATYYNAFGETTACAPVGIAVSASGKVVIVVPNLAGSLGAKVYGRAPGIPQFIGYIPSFGGSDATSAASGTGTIASLTCTALTNPIPEGATFMIDGDTNTPPVIFTMAETAAIGSVTISVVPIAVTTTIAPSGIQPVLVDTGAVTPFGGAPSVDRTAGVGTMGYQHSALGPVGNPYGVSLEFWEKRIIDGEQATDYPFWHIVWPKVTGLHTMARDYTNAALQTMLEGIGRTNDNWGSGPVGDWPFDSTELEQRMFCGADIVPVSAIDPIGALL
jgi:hypothetical protein